MVKEKTESGIEYINFGIGAYTQGMEAITFNPKDITFKQVMEMEKEGIFLHPTLEPNSLEIFALKGTKEQYKDLYQMGKDLYVTIGVMSRFGFPTSWNDEEIVAVQEYSDKLYEEYRPWYEVE